MRLSWGVTLMAMELAAATVSAGVHGQATTVLRTRDDCRGVTLHVSRPLSFDAEHEALGRIDALQGSARDSRGRYWFAMGGGALVAVVRPDGVVAGTVGRRGGGPREFNQPSALVVMGDSMLVFDAGLGRVSVVDAELEVVRSFPLAGQVFAGAMLEWPIAVVSGMLPGGELGAHPFHLLDVVTGRVESSFGGGDDAGAARPPRALQIGHVAVDRTRREIWTSLRTRFDIRRWSFEGQPLSAISADPRLFPPGGSGRIGSPTTPPDPQVFALQLTDGGLFVLLVVPRPQWRQAWRGSGARMSAHGGSVPLLSALLERKALLIDPAAPSMSCEWGTSVEAMGLGIAEGFMVEADAQRLIPRVTIAQVRFERP